MKAFCFKRFLYLFVITLELVFVVLFAQNLDVSYCVKDNCEMTANKRKEQDDSKNLDAEFDLKLKKPKQPTIDLYFEKQSTKQKKNIDTNGKVLEKSKKIEYISNSEDSMDEFLEFLSKTENENAVSGATGFETDTQSPTSSNDKARESPMKLFLTGLRNELSDTKEYRQGYPDQEDDESLNDNFLFLTGKMQSNPDGDYIDKILKNWWGNYELLEMHHGYIQWLFPIRAQGLNSHAHPLQMHELQRLKDDKKVRQNLLKSYKMMLDFFGIKMQDIRSGKLERAQNYQTRYKNLIRRTHNNLRLTRILKCLGEFELEIYQIEFVKFLIEEIFVTGELGALAHSLTKFWIHTVKDDKERLKLIEYVESLLKNIN